MVLMAIDFSHVTGCLCVRLKAFSYRIIALFRLAGLAEFQTVAWAWRTSPGSCLSTVVVLQKFSRLNTGNVVVVPGSMYYY